MAEPKKKLSKTRSNIKRNLFRVVDQPFSLCSKCQEPIRPHTVCVKCGSYKGQQIKSQLPTRRIVLDNSEEKK